MHTMKKSLDKALAAVCVVLFGVLLLTATWQVFARQVVQDPSSWSEKLATSLLVWLALFGSALVFGERGHIAVDLVVRKLPAPAEKAVAVLVQVLIAVFALGVLVWGGARAAGLAWVQQVSALPTQLGVLYLVMPVAGLLIVFYSLYHVLSVLRAEEAPLEGSAREDAI